MTYSQFETLRQEFRALRGDFDQRFDRVNQPFDSAETRPTKLALQLEAKPDNAFVFQTLLAVNASFIALIGMTPLVFRSFMMPG